MLFVQTTGSLRRLGEDWADARSSLVPRSSSLADEAGNRTAEGERVALRVGLTAADVARDVTRLVRADVGVCEGLRRTVRGRERECQVECGRVEYRSVTEMRGCPLTLVLTI